MKYLKMNWANKNKGIVLLILIAFFIIPVVTFSAVIDLGGGTGPTSNFGDLQPIDNNPPSSNAGTGDGRTGQTVDVSNVNSDYNLNNPTWRNNANPLTYFQGQNPAVEEYQWGSSLSATLQKCGEGNCGWNEIFQIADALGQLAMVFTTIVATVLFVYAGFLYISAQGDTGKIQKATGIFKAVIIGFVIILVSYVLISELLEKVAVQGLSNIIQ